MAFRKRSNVRTIQGTMTSSHTGQVITSSGNESLDTLFGGGLPMGSILLLDEDQSKHHTILVKYFLAEGVASNQDVFMASVDDFASTVMDELPAVISNSPLDQPPGTDPDDVEMSAHTKELRICWRYNGLPLVKNENIYAKIGHQFDLSRKMDKSVPRNSIIRLWTGSVDSSTEEGGSSSIDSGHTNATNTSLDGDQDSEMLHCSPNAMDVDTDQKESGESSASTEKSANESGNTVGIEKTGLFHNPQYQELFDEIRRMVTNEKYVSSLSVFKSFCRVGITSLGAPLWNNDHFEEDVLKFLTTLRAVLHTSHTACIITMPMYLIRTLDKTLEARILNLVDYAIELQPFSTAEPFLDNYTGMLKIHKVTALNTLAAYKPETFDLVYRIRRSKLTIENLHLPPAIEESATSSGSVDSLKPDVNCNSNSKLEF